MGKRKRVPPELIDRRRSIIASLLARGLTQAEIMLTLNRPKYTNEFVTVGGELVPNPHYLINPNTGEPFDKSTISRDVKALREQWQDEALGDVDAIYSEQLFKIREAFRVAWSQNDIGEVRQLLALEIKLTGTARPDRKELRWDDNQFERLPLVDVKELSDADLARVATSGSE